MKNIRIKKHLRVINNLERRYLETDSDWMREEISQYQSDTKCEKCNGFRLKMRRLFALKLMK